MKVPITIFLYAVYWLVLGRICIDLFEQIEGELNARALVLSFLVYLFFVIIQLVIRYVEKVK
jgi:hypothetical protein